VVFELTADLLAIGWEMLEIYYVAAA